MMLPALVYWHRAPLRVDLARHGLTLRTNDETWSVWRGPEWLGWNEIWDYVTEIMREPSSHLMSALVGDRYVPDPAERAAWAVFEQWLNTQRKRGGFRKVTRPWAGAKPVYQEATPEIESGRAKRRERLAALF